MNLPLGPEHRPSASYYLPLRCWSRPSSRGVLSAAGSSSHLPRSFFSPRFIPAGISPLSQPLPSRRCLGWQEVSCPLWWRCPPVWWLCPLGVIRVHWAKATLGTGSRERQPEPRLPRTANSLGRSRSEAAQAREARDQRGHAVSPSCPQAVPELSQPGPWHPRVPLGLCDPRDRPASCTVRLWKTW